MAGVISVSGKQLRQRYQKQQPEKSDVDFSLADGKIPTEKKSMKKIKGIGPAAIVDISREAQKAYEKNR